MCSWAARSGTGRTALEGVGVIPAVSQPTVLLGGRLRSAPNGIAIADDANAARAAIAVARASEMRVICE